MKRAMILAGLAALLAPGDAAAQMLWTDQAFLNANIGVQAGSHTLATNSAFELYEEPATISSDQSVDGGAFFEIAAGYKVWRNLTVGLAFSHMSSDADVNITGSIPDQAITDRPRPVSGSVSGAGHSENALHLQGVWMMPVTDKVDVGFQFGPTIFFVSQDVPTSVSVSEPGPTITSISVTDEGKTTMGIHFGIDVTYLIRPRLGIGGLARYSWGSIDVPVATDNLTVGGFQLGVGVRYRFDKVPFLD